MKGSAFRCEDAYYFLYPDHNPSFWVTHAGISYCDETYKMSRASSASVVIEYVYKGTGTLWVEQCEYHPSGGDIYILPEHSKHSYYPDPDDPWTKIFVNLRGTAVTGLIQSFGLHERIVYHQCQGLSPIFESIFEIVKKDIPIDQVMEECGMMVMKLLLRLSQYETNEHEIPEEVQTVKRFIDSKYYRNLTMNEIAASVYRSNDYIKKRFKQYYGVTPYAYYLDLKMTHAKYMLRRTNLSIKQIADRLGFKSDRYFSKRFREATGITATQYRKKEMSREGSTSGE